MRLKDSVIEENLKKQSQLEKKEANKLDGNDDVEEEKEEEEDVEDSNKLKWQYFDEDVYIDRTRLQPGQDAYARNKFNQAASDRIRSNRGVTDTRHARWVPELLHCKNMKGALLSRCWFCSGLYIFFALASLHTNHYRLSLSPSDFMH